MIADKTLVPEMDYIILRFGPLRPLTLQAIANVIGYPPQLDGNTPHTYAIEHGDIWYSASSLLARKCARKC